MQSKKLIAGLLAFTFLLMSVISISSMDDGAYLIGRSTSYVNPLTGTTQDGGTNIALGESMVGSIVETSLLVEQVNGAYYVTIGLGLASNVSNVRFQIMSANGTFSTVSATITGTSTSNGDSVHHYRIQVNSLNDYISPILYVTPMGRDVQFFIQLQPSSMIAGTGIYQSLMVPASSASTQTQGNDVTAKNEKRDTQDSTQVTNDTAEETENKTKKVGTVTKKSLFKNVNGLSLHSIKSETNTTKKTSTPYIVGTIMLVVVIAIGGGYYVKKVKK